MTTDPVNRPMTEASTMRHDRRLSLLAASSLICCLASWCSTARLPSAARGDEPRQPPAASTSAPAGSGPAATGDATRRDELFRGLMKNVKFSGHFTVDGGKTDDLQKDEYVVSAATKLGSGDMWVLTSRIRYGTVDLTVPVPVMVRWAGDTPVICLDDVGIPGLGTFSARIVIDRGKYAGTWTHGDKGGHMFGSLLPAENDSPLPLAPPNTPAR